MGISSGLIKWIKGKFLLIAAVVLVLLFVIWSYSTRYQTFEKEFIGIEFHLNEDVCTEKLMIFDGKLSDPIIGNKRFEGRIIYGEEVYETELHFKDNEAYVLTYDNRDSNQMLRELFIDEDFETVMATIHEKTSSNTTSWNSGSGLVFTAPASNNSEGFKIYESLFKRYNVGE